MGRYYCTQCERPHNDESGVGKDHLQYKGEEPKTTGVVEKRKVQPRPKIRRPRDLTEADLQKLKRGEKISWQTHPEGKQPSATPTSTVQPTLPSQPPKEEKKTLKPKESLEDIVKRAIEVKAQKEPTLGDKMLEVALRETKLEQELIQHKKLVQDMENMLATLKAEKLRLFNEFKKQVGIENEFT